MSSRQATLVSLIATLGLYLCFWLVGALGRPALSTPLNESLLKAALWVPSSLLIVALLWRLPVAGALRELGLFANPLAGYGFGLVTAIPLATLWTQVTLSSAGAEAIAGTSLIGPFAEEVLFRGFLLRQLIRRAGRRPLWSMAVSALVFGCAHLTLLVDYSRGQWIWVPPWAWDVWLRELGLAAIGGLLLAWIVYRWDSLWPAVGLHSCLNFSWQVTTGAPHVTVFETTMLRLTSVAIALYVTWRFTRRPAAARSIAPSSIGNPRAN
ncbi:MAG: CPBP family intramembrane glutamic endopeptidase [Vicinamibacterales bacterium]